MGRSENTFPMDVTDPSSLPWNFHPEGYLVVILTDTEEAERAEAALVEGGFAPQDMKLYTGEQILDNHEEYMRRRSVTSKMVGSVADDVEGRELYLGYARDARCALWLRLPGEADVRKTLLVLADYHYVHTRYYGTEQQTDFHLS
jgi:hypothetical protein